MATSGGVKRGEGNNGTKGWRTVSESDETCMDTKEKILDAAEQLFAEEKER